MKKVILFIVMLLSVASYSQNAAYWKNGIRLGTQTQPNNPKDGQIWFDGDDLFLYDSITMLWENITNSGTPVTAGVGLTDVAGTFNVTGPINTGEFVGWNLQGTGAFGITDQTGSGILYQNNNLLLEGGNNAWLRAGEFNTYVSAGTEMHLGGDDSVPTGSMITASNTDILFKAQYIGDPVPIRIQPQNDLATGQLNYVLTKIADNGTVGWQASGSGGAFEVLNEGNGNGIVKTGRTAVNYGNIGLNAVDLSTSASVGVLNGATGNFSLAAGLGARATGQSNIAMGNGAEATGDLYAAAFNTNTQASGRGAFATGISTIASGRFSFSGGDSTQATGNNSVSFGRSNISSGINGVSFGFFNRSRSFCETVIGLNATDVAAISTTGFNVNDRLFVVGNGPSTVSTRDALEILKSGNISFPSLSIAQIDAASNNSAVTKEWVQANSGGVSQTQGIFTPTVIDATGGATYSAAIATGEYIKTGNQVSFTILVNTISTTGTPTGNLRIGGLPFINASTIGTPVSIGVFRGLASINTSIYGRIGTGDDFIGLQKQTGFSTNEQTLFAETLTNGAFEISGTYITN